MKFSKRPIKLALFSAIGSWRGSPERVPFTRLVSVFFLVLVSLIAHYSCLNALEKKFNGVFSGTQKLSVSTVNDCVLFSGAPSIKIEKGVISGIGFFQNIHGTVSGDRVVFENDFGDQKIRYSGSIHEKDGEYEIHGTFSAVDGQLCEGFFVLHGGEISLSASGRFNGNVIDWLRKFSPIDELMSRQYTMNEIVDKALIADSPDFIPGSWELKTNIALTNNSKTINIPFSYSISEKFKLTAAMPIVWLDNELVPGNISGSVTMTSGSYESQVLRNTLLFDLPTGNDTLSTGALNVQIGQSWITEMVGSRLFLSYYYRYTSAADNLDTGDKINMTLGFGNPWELNNIYGILSYDMIMESMYWGTGLGDKQVLVNLSFGLVSQPDDFRIGLSLPLMTSSDYYVNSDRLISLDFGYRFK